MNQRTVFLTVIALVIGPWTLHADNAGPGGRISTRMIGNSPRELIVGKWKIEKGPEEATVEFTSDGGLRIKHQQLTIGGKYRFIDQKTVEIVVSMGNQFQAVQLKVSVTPMELTAQQQGQTRVERFRRVR